MDHSTYLYHYNVAIATGLDKEKAKLYANSQVTNHIDINHLRVIK